MLRISDIYEYEDFTVNIFLNQTFTIFIYLISYNSSYLIVYLSLISKACHYGILNNVHIYAAPTPIL